MSTEEQSFIRAALEQVEKAQRVHRIKQIAITVLAFAAALWLALQRPSREPNGEYDVMIFVGLVAGVCTAKIMSLINKNTKAVLQAIADLQKP